MVTKYLFQFGFFPWNTHAVLRRYENKPYFPPRILGLEKTDGYIKYDLVQLMALFFHRSQLLVSPPGQGSRRHLPAHSPPAVAPKRQAQVLCVPGCGHASLLPPPSPCSATASGTTKRTLSLRTTTEAVGRRGLRRSQQPWDPRGSQ